MRDSVTLIVPQGIGDVFWIHQLVAPHFARVNYRVMIGRDHRPDVQRRLAGWVETWGCDGSIEPCGGRGGAVDFIERPDADYQAMLDRPRGVKELLARFDAGETTQEFSVNRWLEAGVPLEAIEPELPVWWDVPIRLDPFPLTTGSSSLARSDGFPGPGKRDRREEEPVACCQAWKAKGYVAVYVCGDTRHLASQPAQHDRVDAGQRVWTVEQWAELIGGCVPTSTPLVLIGAPYDGDVLSRLAARLQFDHGYQTKLVTDATPAQAMYVIAGASLFVSYQSGLAILAEQFRIPQIKIWFADDRHRALKWTWVHPERRQSADLLFAHFDQSPADVAREARDRAFFA